MEKENVQEMINKAIHDMQTYKNPDLTKFVQYFNPIVEALGFWRPLEKCHIEQIWQDLSNVEITVSWSCRGGNDSEEIRIPNFILNNSDPVSSAKNCATRRKIKMLEAKIMEAEEQLLRLKKELEEAKNSFSEIQGQK